MYLPVPALAAIGIAFLVLIWLALRRKSGDRDLIAPPRSSAFTPPPVRPADAPLAAGLPPDVEAEVRRLIAAGNKIEAIKELRAATHLGLREAKEMVERM